jgi:hypothetical protein
MVFGEGGNTISDALEETYLCHGAGVGGCDQNFGCTFRAFLESFGNGNFGGCFSIPLSNSSLFFLSLKMPLGFRNWLDSTQQQQKGRGCILKYSPYYHPPTTYPPELTIGPRRYACCCGVHIHFYVALWGQLEAADHR